jgi:uncharacterized protein (TIGR03437 family)
MRPHTRLFNRKTIAALAVTILITIIIIGSHLSDRDGAAGRIINSVAAQGTGPISVNGASYMAPVTPGSFAILRGTNMTNITLANPPMAPFTTQLGGTSVRLVDANNVSFDALVFFVAPVQINFIVPDQVAPGTMNFTVTSGDGSTQTGSVQVVRVAPALFTYNQSGQGIALGVTTYDGFTYTQIGNVDGSPNPIDPGYPSKPIILSVFGTGFRYAESQSLSLRIGNVDYPCAFIGVDGSGRPGFDQCNVFVPGNVSNGLQPMSLTYTNPTTGTSQTSNITQGLFQIPVGGGPNLLSLNDVNQIINQCVQSAKQNAQIGTCAVVDRELNTLAVFQMAGSNPNVTITANKPPGGLEGLTVPSMLAAISKAGTAAAFSTQGSAINTRTASFIVQEHFAPGVAGQEGGPLFGVQFSQLPCSDVRPLGQTLPLGLSADLGSVGLFRNGIALGGVSFESNGIYTIDFPLSTNPAVEETVAVGASLGFEAPQNLRIDNIRVNGIRLPYTNIGQTLAGPAPPVTAADGVFLLPARPAPPSRYIPTTFFGGIAGKVDPRFPPINSTDGGLNQTDVIRILTQALVTADRMRAAIRTGGAVPVEINATVVDTRGVVLGIASTDDAPEFGFDVSAQKARSANLLSSPNVVPLLLGADNPIAPIAPFVNAALALGVPLNGSIMYSSRGLGNLARTFFPDGQDDAINGPFSVPAANFSPFNTGLQLNLVTPDLVAALAGNPSVPCVDPLSNGGLVSLGNGLQIFAGSAVLFKNGVRVGAVGISGDGIDQDSLTSRGGSSGFEAPANITSDNVIINTPGGRVRLSYHKFPAFPFL